MKYIDQIKHSDYIHKNKGNIGVIFRDEGFYERFTVEEYMRYYTEIMLKFSLLEIADK